MHLSTFSIHLPFLPKHSDLSTSTNRTSINQAWAHIFNRFTQLSSFLLIPSHPSFTFHTVFSREQSENFARQMILFSAPPW